jgi:hypothetical protein
MVVPFLLLKLSLVSSALKESHLVMVAEAAEVVSVAAAAVAAAAVVDTRNLTTDIKDCGSSKRSHFFLSYSFIYSLNSVFYPTFKPKSF